MIQRIALPLHGRLSGPRLLLVCVRGCVLVWNVFGFYWLDDNLAVIAQTDVEVVTGSKTSLFSDVLGEANAEAVSPLA